MIAKPDALGHLSAAALIRPQPGAVQAFECAIAQIEAVSQKCDRMVSFRAAHLHGSKGIV
jgi:hypothetical protein